MGRWPAPPIGTRQRITWSSSGEHLRAVPIAEANAAMTATTATCMKKSGAVATTPPRTTCWLNRAPPPPSVRPVWTRLEGINGNRLKLVSMPPRYNAVMLLRRYFLNLLNKNPYS